MIYEKLLSGRSESGVRLNGHKYFTSKLKREWGRSTQVHDSGRGWHLMSCQQKMAAVLLFIAYFSFSSENEKKK